MKDLLALYNDNTAFYERDDSWDGFKWINADDKDSSVYSMARFSDDETVIAIINMTPVERYDYWLSAPKEGTYKLILNSDDKKYSGDGMAVLDEIVTDNETAEFENRIRVTLPPMSVLYYKLEK